MYSIATEKEILKYKQDFIGRKIKAKDWLEIIPIDGASAFNFVKTYHYLGKALFLSVSNFGCIIKGTNSLVAVASYGRTRNLYTSRTWFGIDDADNILELTRLCTHPLLNKTDVSSFMLGGSIKYMKHLNDVYLKRNDEPFCRAIVTLADASKHNGTVYRTCNFKYYGLTDPKSDFYTLDGRKNPRCRTFWVHGVWLPRTQKHRYGYILDKTLQCRLQEQPIPSYDTIGIICCKGTKRVYDNRFFEWFTCPICCGKLEPIREETNE